MRPEPWLHFWGMNAPSDRKAVLDCLAGAGIRTRAFDSNQASGDGILCVAHLNDDVCEFVRELNHRHDRVLVLQAGDAAADSALVWRLLHAGASDVLAWSSADIAGRIKARFERWHAVDALVHSPPVQDRLVGVSAAWRSALRQIVEVARFTSAFVLLIGESGTGKELVARLVHELDSDAAAQGELVVVDCTTIVPELSGSEFFGHERGAFTGAVATRDGAFAAADGGTLFLDEVGELPMPLQAQLLRVIQEGTYKRVGGNAWRARCVPAGLRNQQEPAGGGRGRPFPQRSVLPHRQLGLSGAAAAGAARGYPAAGEAFPARVPARHSGSRLRTRGARLPARSDVSGQCSRPAPSRRAHRQSPCGTRPDHGRRHPGRRISGRRRGRRRAGATRISSRRSAMRSRSAPD